MNQLSGDFLYHGTGIYSLAEIVRSNTMLEGVHWGRKGEPNGPRFSRWAEVAAKFILNSVHWGEGGIIVLDRIKLEKDFRLVDYVDVDLSGTPWPDEAEEVVVVTPQIGDLDRYLVSVVCLPAILAEAENPDQMDMAMSECGWPFEAEGPEGIVDGKAALLNLAGHTKLNAWIPPCGMPVTGNWEIKPSTTDPILHVKN